MPMSPYMQRLRDRVGTQLLEIPSVSVLAFDERDRVLLVHHGDTGRWTTPGGAVEPLERPADAAVREMWEETGLHVELVGLLGVFGGPEFQTRYSNGDEASFLMTVFEGRPIAGTLRPDGDETLDVRYFAASELSTVALQDWVPAVLEAVWDRRDRAHFAPARWRPSR